MTTEIAIPGYRIVRQLYSGFRSQIYRGISESNHQSVVLKLLKSEYPTLDQLVQFRHQYTIVKDLDLPGVVKHICLKNHRNGYLLVMEDFGGVSLSEGIIAKGKKENPFFSAENLSEFLHIAIQIVQTLEELHYNCIIHKDINPHNILINSEQQVKLIDFSISSQLPKELQENPNPNILEGTLAYISPEQTGRMNRGIDYRTDFYSLGVTFYELLTGQLPFYEHEPMKLVHCHLARVPIPPIMLNPAIGQTLNAIVLKLMAKTAEERYQTASGVRVDLEKCLNQSSTTGSITPFELAQRDVSERFIIPEKLYGRSREVATLLEAFNRVSQGSTEMMLVTGSSGIGKTAVISDLHKPIVRQQGYFIRGKFDQFKHDIPFSAWVQVFQNLIRQLLTENTASLAQWKDRVLAALGEQSGVMTDVIPELERLIGRQTPPPVLEGSAAQNRFNFLFEKFIQVFATKEHPLVIFLDDLQWADSASLKLMQLLMGSDTGYLLLIGAYRDNEVSQAHPLMLALDKCRQSVTINQIALAPLNQRFLNRLIADTLLCPPRRTDALTKLVFQKTKGNPFFSNQLLKSIHEEGLIFFDFSRKSWQYDIAAVEFFSASDNVVEFVAAQLQKLPLDTQSVLRLAACIGSSFDLATLSLVCNKSLTDTATALWKVLQEGLIIPTNENYKFFQSKPDEVVPASKLPVSYKFLHDRVQQAAYFLIPEEQKKSAHLEIGRLLLNNTPIEEREEKIFDIVNQLNIGVESIHDQAERDGLVHLNMIAGRRAKASTAYAAALEYLTIGTKLLSTSGWLLSYELTLTIHEELVEAAYLGGDFKWMNRFANTVLQKAKTVLDRIKVYEIKLQAHAGDQQTKRAINTGLTVLKLLGLEFSKKPTDLDVELGMSETRSHLSQFKNVEDLINLPKMTDPMQLAAVRIMSSLTPACFFTNHSLFTLVVCKQINLLTQYGNCSYIMMAYASYGLILCSSLENIETGYQFGKLAIKALERFDVPFQKATVYSMFCNSIRHWKEPIQAGLSLLLEGYISGLETGNFQFASLAASQYSFQSYLSGKELSNLERDMEAYSKQLAQIKQKTALQRNEVYRYAVINLLDKNEDPCLLTCGASSEKQAIDDLRKSRDRTVVFMFYLNKLILLYLFDRPKQAIETIASAEEFLINAGPTVMTSSFYLYDSLTRLSLYPHVRELERESILQRISSNQEKMQKWAHHAPMNYLHKFCLVEAEWHRVKGQYVEAMDYYDRAIAEARENEYLNEEALANELAAKFYLSWGKQTIAQTYLINAYYAYFRWGAIAKVKDLEKHYSSVLVGIEDSQKNRTKVIGTFSTTSSKNVVHTLNGDSESLDFATVLEASQVLSKEIDLERLICTLMRTVLESAGASKGALILQQGDLLLEAMATSTSLANPTMQMEDSKEPNVVVNLLPSLSIDKSEEIPVSIINYVSHTQEVLLINNATVEADFINDPYIVRQQPKSVLCIPIINQLNLIGILYLENKLVSKVFTSNRVEVLKVLSSQAAISIENARLYTNLEQTVKERTAQLERAKQEAEAANRAKTTFLANMSHELRTPLNVILGFSRLMKNGTTSEEQENLSIIHRSGEHLLTLINQVLSLAKIEAGQIILAKNNFDLYHLLTELENTFSLKAKNKGLNLQFDLATDLPQYIRTDEVKLRQVLINLLNNAIKFTNLGSVFVEVSVIARERQLNDIAKICFQVSDTGAGIAPQELDKLFQPFVQTTLSQQLQEGTGLGLSISRQFVNLMGGKITVTSRGKTFTPDITTSKQIKNEISLSNSVTTFMFDIPVSIVDPNDVETQFQKHRVVALAPNQPKYRLLVVDDHNDSRKLLVKFLDPLGFQVREATNGREAIEIWDSWSPHLIWMDIRMPVLDGYRAAKQIKATAKGQATAVIALTASFLLEEKAVIMAAGCDDFVQKPFEEQVILDILSKHLKVHYVYDDAEPIIRASPVFVEPSVLVNFLSTMPEKWIVSLYQAAVDADSKLVMNIIEEISECLESQTLKNWVSHFEFEKILDVVETLMNKN